MQELKIIWFEDNFDDFEESIVPKIIEHCSLNNRVFDYDLYDHYPENFEIHLFEGVYTIAFIDLNLKKGQKGIEIITKLKDYGTFIDVLLYSNNPNELITLTEGANFVDGIYRHATLKNIESKMCSVIDQVLYKEKMAIERYSKYKNF